MEVRHVTLDDPMVAPLLSGLVDEYERRYGPNDEMAYADVAQFNPPHGTFVVVVDDDGRTIAGGGLRPIDEAACEVKRMWTATDQRRRGLASMVLRALEDRAVEIGYRTVRLETGPQQPEAVALYDRLGYHRIDPFGPYDLAISFERSLSDER